MKYNQDNRLTRFIDASGANAITADFTYNAYGQRVSKSSSGATTLFLYDFDGNIIAEADGAGNITTEYLYLGSNRLAKVDTASGNIYFYINDRLGTPIMMVDNTNTVVWEATYKPFGEAEVNPGSTVTNNFRFPGQYYDLETGMHYNWHRYYDPSTGGYLTPDPIGLAGGINLYLYADGNPINMIDPKGLAYFAKRSFSGPWIPGISTNPIDDSLNTEWVHEQLFFEDGGIPPNIGFYLVKQGSQFISVHMIELDTSGYRKSDTGYNDCVMRKAVESYSFKIRSKQYSFIGRPGKIDKFNCQDWADGVRNEYQRLMNNPQVQQECCIN